MEAEVQKLRDQAQVNRKKAVELTSKASHQSGEADKLEAKLQTARAKAARAQAEAADRPGVPTRAGRIRVQLAQLEEDLAEALVKDAADDEEAKTPRAQVSEAAGPKAAVGQESEGGGRGSEWGVSAQTIPTHTDHSRGGRGR